MQYPTMDEREQRGARTPAPEGTIDYRCLTLPDRPRTVDFEIVLETGDAKETSTDTQRLYIVLFDQYGKRSRDILLDSAKAHTSLTAPGKPVSEKKSRSYRFVVKEESGLGRVTKVELWLEPTSDQIFVDYIEVKQPRFDSTVDKTTTPTEMFSTIFPWNRWITDSKTRYTVVSEPRSTPLRIPSGTDSDRKRTIDERFRDLTFVEPARSTIPIRPVDYEIILQTGDVNEPAVDGLTSSSKRLYVVLVDEFGNRSKDILLEDYKAHSQIDYPAKPLSLQRGRGYTFVVRELTGLGPITRVEMWLDRCSEQVYVVYLEVKQPRVIWAEDKTISATEKFSTIFPWNRWITDSKPRIMTEYDCSLPQNCKYPDQREKELKLKKTTYNFADRDEKYELPKGIEDIPEEDKFARKYKYEFLLNLANFTLDSLQHLKMGEIGKKLERFDEYGDIYKKVDRNFQVNQDLRNLEPRWFEYTNWYRYSKPKTFDIDWKSDEHFGRQRLAGVNCTVIELCTAIPPKLQVTPGTLDRFITTGSTLEEAMDNKEVYMVDYKVLEGIEGKTRRQTKYELCCPIALFHFNRSTGKLLPICIQLMQQGEDNPVFLPDDPPMTWLFAKMWFNNADAQYHESTTHLGFSHFLMETFCISVNRCLSPSHPVYRLLAPHFLWNLAINKLATDTLLNQGGWIDDVMTMGVKGTYQIIDKAYKDWRMDTHMWLPGDLKRRGVDDTTTLPVYEYRDDAIRLHDAIQKYVKDVLHVYYESPDQLMKDKELQAWAECLACPRRGDIKGVFGGGFFYSMEDLEKTCTSIIYTASVFHAAVNNEQYNQYCYPPNYPASIEGERIKDKSKEMEPTEKEITERLPGWNSTMKSMVIFSLLCNKTTNGLGDFEVQHLYEPKAVDALKRFQYKLVCISEDIQKRVETSKKHGGYPYLYLDPREVTNATTV